MTSTLERTLALLEQQSREYLRDDFDNALGEIESNTDEMLTSVTHMVQCRADLELRIAHLRDCEYKDADDCADPLHDYDTACATCPTEDAEIKAWTDGTDRGGRWDTHSFKTLFTTLDILIRRERDPA